MIGEMPLEIFSDQLNTWFGPDTQFGCTRSSAILLIQYFDLAISLFRGKSLEWVIRGYSK